MNEKQYFYYHPKNKVEDINSSLDFMYLLAASYGVNDLEFEVVEIENVGKVIRADQATFAKWQEVLSLMKQNSEATQAPVAEQEVPEQKAVEDEDTEVVVDTNDFLAPNLDQVLAPSPINEISEVGSSSSSDGNKAKSPNNGSKQPGKRLRDYELRALQGAALSVVSYDSLFAKPRTSGHNTRPRFVALDDEVEVASYLYRR